MRKQPKPYFVAEIAYNPSWPDMPWQVYRMGRVAEQGGLTFGGETLHFETIEDATIYLEASIKGDLSEYDRIIKEKEDKEKI